MTTSNVPPSTSRQLPSVELDSSAGLAVRHGHEANIRRTTRYAAGAFALSLAGNVGQVALTTPRGLPIELVTGKIATAAVGPALIGAGLELWIRRPPPVIAERYWPVVGTWRDFPVIGYVIVMMIGFVLSFDHLRSLAELVGVPDWAAWLLPVGIDLAAISVTLDHAQSKKAVERLNADQIESAAAKAARARLEVERIEAESRAADARRSRLEAHAATINASTEPPGSTTAQTRVESKRGQRGAKASKQDLARDWLTEFGVESNNADVIAGLGWAGSAGDRKAIQRARAALKPEGTGGADGGGHLAADWVEVSR